MLQGDGDPQGACCRLVSPVYGWKPPVWPSCRVLHGRKSVLRLPVSGSIKLIQEPSECRRSYLAVHTTSGIPLA